MVEALDLPSPQAASRAQSQALEALARNAPAPEPPPAGEPPIPEDELLRLSYGQIDDYETCPLKYRYVHVLRVPLLTHHAVVYGHAVHEAVRRHFEARLAGRAFSADDLVAAFRAAWVSEGFLSREHEEQRLRAGEAMLRRFHAEEAASPVEPDRGRGGVRVRARAQPRPGPLRPRDRAGGRGHDRGLQDRRRPRREGRARSAHARACSSTSTPSRTCDEGPAARPGRAALPGDRASWPGKRPTLEEAAETEARIRAAAAAIRQPRVPGAAHLDGLRPVPVPGHLPPHRAGARPARGNVAEDGAGMSKRIGFAGLGLMGGRMARNLLKKGFPTTVWNRTPERCAAAREGGRDGRAHALRAGRALGRGGGVRRRPARGRAARLRRGRPPRRRAPRLPLPRVLDGEPGARPAACRRRCASGGRTRSRPRSPARRTGPRTARSSS